MAKSSTTGQSCASCLSSCLIVFFNIIFFIIGVVMAVIGIIIKLGADTVAPIFDKIPGSIGGAGNGSAGGNESIPSVTPKDLMGDFMNVFDGVGIPFAVIGIYLVLMSFFGFLGACCKVKGALMGYVMMLQVLFLAHVVLLVCLMLGVFSGMIRAEVETSLEENYEGMATTEPNTLMWNYFMLEYDCCGVTNFTDFDKLSNETGWDRKTIVDGETYTMVTPLACCKSEGSYPEFEPLQDNCTYEPSDENNNWDKGCWEAVHDEVVEPNKTTFLGINCAVLALEVITIICAVCLGVSTRKKSEKAAAYRIPDNAEDNVSRNTVQTALSN